MQCIVQHSVYPRYTIIYKFFNLYFGSLHLFYLHEHVCLFVFSLKRLFHCSSALISKYPEKGCGRSLDPYFSQTEIGINTFKCSTYICPVLRKYFYSYDQFFYVCVSVCEFAAEAFGSLLV